jgi:hypothetical protein
MWLGGRQDAELRGVGLGDGHEPGVQEPVRELLGPGRLHIAEEGGALGDAGSRPLGQEVLQDHRHPSERPVGQLAGGHLAGALVEGGDDGVQLAVDGLGPVDGGVDQLDRRHLPGADQVGLGGGVESSEIVHDADRSARPAVALQPRSRRDGSVVAGGCAGRSL